LDPRIALVFRLVARLSKRRRTPELFGAHARVRLVLTGPGGGEIGLVTDSGCLEVTREVPRPPTSVITLRAAHFRELLAGKIGEDAMQMTERIHIDGDPLGMTVVSAVVRIFRSEASGTGPRVVFTHAVSRWMGA
jgi:hypothetical protein